MEKLQYYIFLFDTKTETIVDFDIADKNKILDSIYFLQLRPPTLSEITSSTSEKLLSVLKTESVETVQNNIKLELSKIDDKLPLFDIYTENIYLIKKYNVYTRVTHQHYRFPEQDLLNEISESKKILEKTANINDKLLTRKIKKMELLLTFMSYFDLGVLFDTYVKVFYKYSKFVGKETTVCKNPSFLPQFSHIKPYLTRSEVINSALNYGIALPDNYIEPEEINKICKKIIKYQINSNVLLQHQHHIINNGSLGLVQYYTLQGSFFMNQYLRAMTQYHQQNEYLESMIMPMWDLVVTAPEFDKSYTFYRFVGRDDYLKSTKIGEIYVEKGFMSTTRDPFYRADLYKFGFILIKIKVPANKKGVALCLETISHFPEEQEIIFPPNSKFKLVARDENCEYYHTDINFASKVKTRYEFEWIENEPIKFNRIVKFTEEKPLIDFLRLKQTNSITLLEKLKYFDNVYVNELGQFNVSLGDKTITVLTEWFDSSGAYKNYYALETNLGYAIYSVYKGYILFYIELAEIKEGKQMHVNYFVKYSSVDPAKVIGNENLIKFFSSVAYYFDIHTVVMYANYLNCGTELIQAGGSNFKKDNSLRQREFEGVDLNKTYKKNINISENTTDHSYGLVGGSYCNDLYQYLLNGTKAYSDTSVLSVELQPKFSYHDLNFLKKTPPTEILSKEDRDEIYQMYDKYYKNLSNFSVVDTIGDFYLWLIEENKCYLLDTFVNKIDKVLGKNNPFKNDLYILDSSTYLYNRKYIPTYPTNISLTPSLKRSVIKESIEAKFKDNDFDEFRAR